MTADRKLLELAAKGAGLSVKWNDQWNCLFRDARPVSEFCSEWVPWRPLADDGDALRLAVRLGIGFVPYPEKMEAFAQRHATGPIWVKVDDALNYDMEAATRRAIVLVAADIGEAMP